MRRLILTLVLLSLSVFAFSAERPGWVKSGIKDSNDIIYGIGDAKFPSYSASLSGAQSKAVNQIGIKVSAFLNDVCNASSSKNYVRFYKENSARIISYVVSGVAYSDSFRDENGTVWALCSVKKSSIPNAFRAVLEENRSKKNAEIQRIQEQFVSDMKLFSKRIEEYKTKVNEEINALEAERDEYDVEAMTHDLNEILGL